MLMRQVIVMLSSNVHAQIGAAFTVLQAASGEAAGPLELQAAKPRLLHLEPAAGAAGLAMLAARLQQMPSHDTLHLRTVNPHVAAIFQVCMPANTLMAPLQIATQCRPVTLQGLNL